MRIMLDPGHGEQNRGFLKVPGFEKNSNEGTANFIYAVKHLKPELEKYGIEVGLTKNTVSEDPSLKTRGAKGRGYDLLLSLHTNAGGGRGVEIWDSTNPKESLPELAKTITAAISTILETVDRGVKYKKNSDGSNWYGILRHGMAKHNMIIENCFHDNLTDVTKYVERMDQVAKVTANAIANYFNLTKGGEEINTQIIGPATATQAQAEEWARKKNNNPEFIGLAEIFFKVFNNLGLDPVVGFAQMAHETGFLYKVKSAAGLDASYHNPCGLKITQGGGDFQASAHKRFKNWEEGITAQADHLALYAGHKDYPKHNTPDPRHFPYLLGRAKTVMDLGGNWAPSKEYGNKLMKFIDEIRKTTAPENLVTQPDNWAKEAWDWGIQKGITDGSNPQGAATRQEVITMIYRLKEEL